MCNSLFGLIHLLSPLIMLTCPMFNNIFLIAVSRDVSKFAEKHQAGDKQKKEGLELLSRPNAFFRPCSIEMQLLLLVFW